MKNADILNFEMIEEARDRIKDYVVNTPFIQSTYLSEKNRNVFYKLENTQPTRAFKIRGALNKMLSLSDAEKNIGVATISSGNHGISVAMAANMLGIKNALIIVPKNTSHAKTEKIKYFNGQIVFLGNNYDEAHALGMEFIKDKNLTFIDSYYDDEIVYAGQGTIALEILEKILKLTLFLHQ